MPHACRATRAYGLTHGLQTSAQQQPRRRDPRESRTSPHHHRTHIPARFGARAPVALAPCSCLPLLDRRDAFGEPTAQLQDARSRLARGTPALRRTRDSSLSILWLEMMSGRTGFRDCLFRAERIGGLFFPSWYEFSGAASAALISMFTRPGFWPLAQPVLVRSAIAERLSHESFPWDGYQGMGSLPMWWLHVGAHGE